jgi:hypothetical protein
VFSGGFTSALPIKIRIGAAALAGQSRLIAAEDERVSLEGNEQILPGGGGGGAHGEETATDDRESERCSEQNRK